MRIGDFYADPELLRAQVLLRAARRRARARSSGALRVGSRQRVFQPARARRRRTTPREWSARLTDALLESSGVGSTGGMHGEDFEHDRHLRPSSIAQPWPFATMHGYSVYSAFARDRLDTNVVPFLCQLQQSFSGKRVLFTEFGNPECPPRTEPRRRLRVSRRRRDGTVCARRSRAPARARRARRVLVVLGRLRSGARFAAAVRPRAARAALRHRSQRRHASSPSRETLSQFAREARDVVDAAAAADCGRSRALRRTSGEHRREYRDVLRHACLKHARTLIVTGASSGIGRALALAAAREGFDVVLVARRAEHLEEVARSIRARGGSCAVVAGDVTRARRRRRASSTRRCTPSDESTCSSTTPAPARTARCSSKATPQIEAQWQLNVAAPLRIARAALPHLAATRGQLVFVGSGRRARPAAALRRLRAAKAAIRAAATQLRRELRARGIAVTYVDPGVVATEFHSSIGHRARPNGPVAAPERVARAILRGIAAAAPSLTPYLADGFTTLAEWSGTLADPIVRRFYTVRRASPSVVLRSDTDRAERSGAESEAAPKKQL